jgi:O-antigen/teichoic acid export membrane protein
VYDIFNIKKIEITKTKYSNEANKRILKTGLFAFGLNFISIYLINTPRYAIDDLLSNEMQTIYGIIIMPATFMGLLGQYIIQPSITKISKYIKDEEYTNLKKVIININLIIILLGILVFVVAYLLEVPVLELVYGVELDNYFESMMIIIVGSVFYSVSIITSAILIAMRKTFSQVVIYFVTSIIATFLAYKFVENMQIKGASITYFITMVIVAFMFILLVIKEVLNYKKEWRNNENINNNSNV